MYLLIQPSEETLQQGETAIERLQQRVTEKMENKGIDIPAAINDRAVILEIAESRVPDAVAALELLTGIGVIAPCIRSEPAVDAILERLSDEGIEKQEFDLVLDGSAKEMIEEPDLIAALSDQGWTCTADADTTLSIHLIGENAYISLETFEGVGGLPVNDDKNAVLALRDRMDVYAGFLAMKQGFRVTPVVKGKQLDTVKEGIDILGELYPPLKPVTMKTETWQDAVEPAIKLLHPQKVITGAVKGDEPLLDEEELGVEVWKPLKDRKEKEILEQYHRLLPVTL